MSDKSFPIQKLMLRRSFIASAVATGMGAVYATDVLARTDSPNPRETCGALTAADPLYLYASIVSKLQPAALIAARKKEGVARKSLSNKLEELWTLSDELKLKLSRQAKIQPTVDRMSTLAKIGRSHARAAEAIRHSKSVELNHANMATQNVITQEIVKTSLALSQQGEKTLKADEWELLQKLLGVIDEIKTIHQPAAVTAAEEFDQTMKSINTNILDIQATLMEASRDIVEGEKKLAETKIKYVITELEKLPSDPQAGNEDPGTPTRDEFLSMIRPILQLISGGGIERLPQVSHHSRRSLAPRLSALITADEIFLPNAIVPSSTVREVVENHIRSGNWWQVVGVTAACLPLWCAYNQTPERLSLIRSAINAVPRGKGSDLDAAAAALNKLTA